jgi:hypothetical protein
MNREWVVKTVELECQIEERRLSLCEATHAICEQAHSVANAAGAAIAVLKADQLVYKAGSGTAADCVGRRVMATLRTSATDQATAEILRVEDADADSRIQSSVCRQFGARSLLILPLYSDGMLAGILQISFDQPHEFADAEVQAYRRLAGLAEKVITATSAPERAKTEPVPPPSTQALTGDTAPVSLSDESSVLWSRTEVRSLFRHAWDAAIAAVIVTASVGIVLYHERSTVAFRLPAAVPQALGPVMQRAPAASLPASRPSPDSLVENATATRPAKLHLRTHPSGSADRVQNFGDDVTVRYFPPQPAVAMRSGDVIEVRRVADDVTVRYFSSRSVQRH